MIKALGVNLLASSYGPARVLNAASFYAGRTDVARAAQCNMRHHPAYYAAYCILRGIFAGQLDLSDPEFKAKPYDANAAYQASKHVQANRMQAVASPRSTVRTESFSSRATPGVATSAASLGPGFDLDGSEVAQRDGAVTPLYLCFDRSEHRCAAQHALLQRSKVSGALPLLRGRGWNR